jgi:hypothetical protein
MRKHLKNLLEADHYIATLGDWRTERLAQLRGIIATTIPEIEEVWKWGVPVYKGRKLVCAISAFHDHIKINFFQGVQLGEYAHMFNSGLESASHRSINFSASDKIDEQAIASLLRAAWQLDQK